MDDIVLTCDSMAEIHFVKHLMHQQFKIKDLGKLRFFLGFEIAHSKSGIFLNQRNYTLELLEDNGFLASKSSFVSFDPNIKLLVHEG